MPSWSELLEIPDARDQQFFNLFKTSLGSEGQRFWGYRKTNFNKQRVWLDYVGSLSKCLRAGKSNVSLVHSRSDYFAANVYNGLLKHLINKIDRLLNSVNFNKVINESTSSLQENRFVRWETAVFIVFRILI